MSKNTRSKANSLSASNASENNDLNELDGGLEAVMQTGYNGPDKSSDYTLSILKYAPIFNENEGETHWPRYSEEFRLIVKRFFKVDLANNDEIISDEINSGIYHMLLRGVGNNCFNLVSSIFRYKGKDAFNYLDEHYLGSFKVRKAQATKAMHNCSMMRGETALQFMTRMHKLEAECIKFKVIPRPEAGQASTLAIHVAYGLPEKYSLLHRSIQNAIHHPTMSELGRMLSEEDHYLKRQDHGRSGNVFAARSEYRGGRRRQRRGRHTPAASGGVRGGSGNPQTAARQRDVTEFRDVTPLLATTTAPAIGGGGRPPYRSHSASGSANTNNRREHPYRNNFKPITCKRCLSRKGTHTAEKCPSTLWCHTCSNASHNSGDCRRNRDNQQ